MGTVLTSVPQVVHDDLVEAHGRLDDLHLVLVLRLPVCFGDKEHVGEEETENVHLEWNKRQRLE